ncbi:MAG: exodeoxyribonuclease VII small subunit [Candidatus Flexifilum sp.]|jgi:exodeoxyribonuclease VII small subunit
MTEPADLHALTFEAAFAELTRIVAQLDDPDLTLDDAVARFERGRALAAHCQALLDQAELRISQVDDDAAGADSASAPSA